MNTAKNCTFWVISLVLLFTSCLDIKGSGNSITETRDVSNFTSVSMGTTGTLIITQGNTESLTIEAESNIMPHIEAEVKGKKLSIGLKSKVLWKSIRPTLPIVYKLNVINLVEGELSGSGAIKATDINARDIELVISGSGDIAIEQLEAESLSVDISGSGDILLSGRVEKQTISINGSGDYQAPLLISQDVSVEISGSGDATVHANEMLDVNVNGSGGVSYHGNPRLSTDINGSGNLTSLDTP